MKIGSISVSRLTFIFACMVCGAVISHSSVAQTHTQDRSSTRKLGRGVSNVFLSVAEIPRAWTDVKQEHGEVAGLTWGTFLGVKHTAMRFGVGVWEIFTFTHDTGPIIYPEFVINTREEDVWEVKTRDAY